MHSIIEYLTFLSFDCIQMSHLNQRNVPKISTYIFFFFFFGGGGKVCVAPCGKNCTVKRNISPPSSSASYKINRFANMLCVSKCASFFRIKTFFEQNLT